MEIKWATKAGAKIREKDRQIEQMYKEQIRRKLQEHRKELSEKEAKKRET